MDEPFPTCLNPRNLFHFLVLSKDKLNVKYVRSHSGINHLNDVGTVQSDYPAPSNCLLYYFEICVKDSGERGSITIGFSDRTFRMGRRPGWEPNSYGYHGSDGNIYNGAEDSGLSYGPTFTVNDVVGAGINLTSQEMFFTKNGKYLGTAFKDVRGELFPTLGLHSANECVEVNFGKVKFLFDVESMIQDEKEKQLKDIENISLPYTISHDIVKSYLYFEGYKSTLNFFDSLNEQNLKNEILMTNDSLKNENSNSSSNSNLNSNSNSNSNTSKMDSKNKTLFEYELENRSVLRQMIRNGKMDDAYDKIKEIFPKILQESSFNVNFILMCQKFIEIVKVGDLEKAIWFSRSNLSQFRGLSSSHDAHLQNCLALLVYEHPERSPVAFLLGESQREIAADAVNLAILSLSSPCEEASWKWSALEQNLRQLAVCQSEKRFLFGGQGEVFDLHKILAGSGFRDGS